MTTATIAHHGVALAAPRPSASALHRGRLSWLSLPRPSLVTVWATAGAGKTTLLSTWAQQLEDAGERVAWVDPGAAGRGAGALDALVAAAFDASDGDGHRTVFIDDAHLASGRQDRRWLAELAGAPVPGFTAVIAGRYQPVIMPSATYGAPSIELRSGDLAFTEQEASDYFGARGISLSRAQLRSILDRTDGWAVAIALMADRLGSTDDTDRFIEAFSGDLRSVADYLVAEVLAGQTDARRRFLMQTSVVDELTVPLAVHLTGRTNAGELLDELEEENTLVRSAGGDSPVFQYHALLRSHLQAQLRRHDYAGSVELHRSASRWFENHGRPDLALEHALAADDPRDVGAVLETSGTSLVFAGHSSLVRRAAALIDDARASTATSHLLSALLDAPHFFNPVAADHHLAVAREHLHLLPPYLRTVFAALALMRAGGVRAIDDAERELDRSECELETTVFTPELDDAALDAKIFAWAARGCAELGRGNGAAASASLQLAAKSGGMAKRPWLSLLLLDMAATSSSTAGRWAETSVIESLMASATQRDGRAHDPAAALAHFTVATAAYTSCDDVQLARLADVIETGEIEDDASLIVPGRVLAQLVAIDGCPNPRGSFEELDRLLQGSAPQIPRALAGAAYRYLDLTIRFHGKPRAREVVRLIGTTLGANSVDYRLACALLQSGTALQGAEAAELQAALESRSRVWSPSNLVLGWLLLGRWAESAGRVATADDRLQRALDLAEQMRAQRPFMASAGSGARLLESRLGRLGSHEGFAQSVVGSYHRIFAPALLQETDSAALTRKEHEILRELPHHQSIAEIARKQQLSANTVKTHLRSIYQKFGVSGRSEAVEHAVRSGLI